MKILLDGGVAVANVPFVDLEEVGRRKLRITPRKGTGAVVRLNGTVLERPIEVNRQAKLNVSGHAYDISR